jgi:pimeloyl-[acyl-carrier protein] methyl ester esterase
MIDGFEKAPENTLKSFYRSCFKPAEFNIDLPLELNEKVLLSDLNQLRDTRFPLIDLDFGATMVALDGAEDKVLLTPRGESITESHYGPKFVNVFENEGHALPFLNPSNCWSYLCSIIPIFERHENNR